MNEEMLEQIVKEVIKNIGGSQDGAATYSKTNSSNKVTTKDYPLGVNRKDLVRTPTDKSLDDITLDNVVKEKITAADLRISAETLEYQAQIADSAGRHAFGKNLRRAAELTKIPDDRILEIYNALRPFRSTKAELIAIADELQNKYSASITSSLVRESADVYEKRDRLRKD